MNVNAAGSLTHAGVPSLRLGLVLPSHNVTQERELGALAAQVVDLRVSVHASRARLPSSPSARRRVMAMQTERCVMELGDAEPHVVFHGDLGPSTDEVEQLVDDDARVAEQLAHGGSDAKVRSYHGSLVQAIDALDPVRIGILDAVAHEPGSAVLQAASAGSRTVVWSEGLGVDDPREVPDLPVDLVVEHAGRALQRAPVDVLVLGARGVLPSMEAVARIESRYAVTVVCPSTAILRAALLARGADRSVPGGGRLLLTHPHLHATPLVVTSEGTPS